MEPLERRNGGVRINVHIDRVVVDSSLVASAGEIEDGLLGLTVLPTVAEMVQTTATPGRSDRKLPDQVVARVARTLRGVVVQNGIGLAPSRFALGDIRGVEK
jgi:hypothetical protein